MKRKHLSYNERVAISYYLSKRMKIQQISILINRPYQTVWKEVKERSKEGIYNCIKAQEDYEKNVSNPKGKYNPAFKLTDEIQRYVEEKLKSKWSPQQIAVKMVDLFGEEAVSTSTIYRYIKSGELQINEKRCLRIGIKKNTIHKRPEEIESRLIYGHYEIDTMIGSKYSTECILTIIERKTRYLYAIKLEDKKSDTIIRNLIKIMKSLMPKSIILDNGREFSEIYRIKELLGCDIYYCDPGSPYQKGSIENANGLLRQYFPKGENFKNVSNKAVIKAVEEINKRPRRVLGFNSPEDMLREEYTNIID